MATARSDLRAYIFSAINIAGILSILGSATSTNRRVYSHWPQEQPQLSSVEPSEGWMSFHELASLKVFGGSNIEDHTIQFNLWHTIDSQNDLIIDQLDALFDNPPVDQYGQQITSDWVILLSQRITITSMYEEDTKMYRKMCDYIFRTTKIPFRVGP